MIHLWKIELWQVEYILSGIMSFAISYLFWRTSSIEAQTFRKLWIWFFFVLGFLIIFTAFSGFIAVSEYMKYRTLAKTFSGTGLLIVLTALFLYLYKYFYK